MKAARSRARDLLNLVGLSGYEEKYPQQLSGGMQQRTAIARAFVHDPKLILMDEPFGALDALTREQMNLEMLRIWRESGKTIIFVTHSIQEAVFLASHCAVLTAGPARMAEYFPIDLPFPRALPIKTTDAFGAYCTADLCEFGVGPRRVASASPSSGLPTWLDQSQFRRLDAGEDAMNAGVVQPEHALEQACEHRPVVGQDGIVAILKKRRLLDLDLFAQHAAAIDAAAHHPVDTAVAVVGAAIAVLAEGASETRKSPRPPYPSIPPGRSPRKIPRARARARRGGRPDNRWPLPD